MDLAAFTGSLNQQQPPAGLSRPLQALWWAAQGDWDQAHRLAQAESGADGAWVHAHLHREEGDLGNASYWYSRAGRAMSKKPLAEEWEAIVTELLERRA